MLRAQQPLAIQGKCAGLINGLVWLSAQTADGCEQDRVHALSIPVEQAGPCDAAKGDEVSTEPNKVFGDIDPVILLRPEFLQSVRESPGKSLDIAVGQGFSNCPLDQRVHPHPSLTRRICVQVGQAEPGEMVQSIQQVLTREPTHTTGEVPTGEDTRGGGEQFERDAVGI